MGICECEQSGMAEHANVAAAYCRKAWLASADEGGERVMSYVRAISLDRDDTRHLVSICATLLNLGRFSDSLHAYEVLLTNDASLRSALELGVPNGAFRTYVRALDRMQRMHPDFHPANEASIRAVSRIMAQCGDSDGDIARAMDVAGAMLLERGIAPFSVNQLLTADEFPPDEDGPIVDLDFVLDVPSAVALDLTMQYVRHLSRVDISIPSSLSVSFRAQEDHHAYEC